MMTVMVAINFIAAMGVPVLVEMKVFDPSREGRDHIWNILKRVFTTIFLLWCIAYLTGIPLLGVLQNPLGYALQATVLWSFLAIPISVVGYFFGRRRVRRTETQ